MINIREQLSCGSFKKSISKTNLALAIVLLASSFIVYAGKITSTTTIKGAEGFGGWNLDNIEVTLDGTQGTVEDGDLDTSWFDKKTGDYSFALDSDYSYEATVSDGTTVMGYAQAKAWPIGEPSGIKIVNDDFDVKEGRPTNCVMSTSYLDDHFLDTAEPLPVLCSGPFQSHKRYKLAMLPSTIDGGDSDSVDLVFNVEAEDGSRDYQIFQKINNWTNNRLAGFTIEIGFGIGADFQLASNTTDVGVDNLSLAVPDSVWTAKQLATFSAGLFGPIDDKHDRPAGYFDPEDRAGYFIDEYPIESGETDSLHATTTLGSDYVDIPAGANDAANQFGNWIPNSMLPYGIFFDDDGDPTTDAELKYWYGYSTDLGGLGWMTGAETDFLPVSGSFISSLGTDPLYTMAPIDDLVNVGLNYLVTVGDVSGFPNSRFTIRITPIKDLSGQEAPMYVGEFPVPSLGFGSSDGIASITPAPNFAIGTTLIASVADADLTGTVDVLISTDDLSVSAHTLTLTEEGVGRAVFTAEVPEEFSNVALTSKVKLTYIDLDDGNGSIDVEKIAETTAVIDEDFGIIQYTDLTFNVDESDAIVSVTVERIGSTVNEATVEYSTQYNTAVGNEDYEASTGSLTFAAGEVSQTIEIALIDDVLHEDDESFNVILSNVEGGALLGNLNNAEVTISDDDSIIVQLSSAIYATAEDSGSVLLTVERNGGFETASVDYTTSDNTAIDGSDYTAATGTFNFAEGEVSKTIEVTLLDDQIHEIDESFTVTLSNVSVDAFIGSVDSSIVTIADNDPVIVQFSNENNTVGEEDGNVFVKVERSSSLGTLTVDYATIATGAITDTDFTAVTGTLTFAEGEASKTIVIALIDDLIHENDETFSVTLSNVSTDGLIGALDSSVVTIADNDPIIVQFRDANYTATEASGNVLVTVDRSSGLDTITVDYATVATGAFNDTDFIATMGTLTFAEGEISKTIIIALIDDLIHEDDETFSVTLSNVSVDGMIGAVDSSVVTIADDDPIIVQFSNENYTVSEDSSNVLISVVRSSGLGTLTVDYATIATGAVSDTDFTSAMGTLTFAEGEISKTIVIALIDDLDHEIYESFAVTLSNVSVGGLLGTADSSIVTIVDNDPIIVQFRDVSYTTREDSGNVLVNVDRSSSLGTLTVDYVTVATGAVIDSDFAEAMGTLTFAEGEISKTIVIALIDDLNHEDDETFSVILSNVSIGALLGTAASSAVTITDDDPIIVQFRDANYTTSENSGNVLVTVDRSSTLGTLTVDYATVATDAVSDTDFTSAMGTLIFAEGESSKKIELLILEDSVVEVDETFSVILSNVQDDAVIGEVGSSVVTITDNDPIIIQFSDATYTLSEDSGTALITVERSSNLGTLTVDYATVAADAVNTDFATTTGTLTFAEGESSKTIEVTLIDDLIHEVDESFTITLSNLSGGALLGTVGSSTVTITDNDPIMVQFSNLSFTVSEGISNVLGGIFQVTVERSSSLGALTVDYATVAADATSDADFAAATGTLTFAEGESSKTIELMILDDSDVEADEMFSVTLNNVQAGALIGVQDSTTITITDNDVAAVGDDDAVVNTSSNSSGGAFSPIFLLIMITLRRLVTFRRK